jgi:hypothetical protein
MILRVADDLARQRARDGVVAGRPLQGEQRRGFASIGQRGRARRP